MMRERVTRILFIVFSRQKPKAKSQKGVGWLVVRVCEKASRESKKRKTEKEAPPREDKEDKEDKEDEEVLD